MLQRFKSFSIVVLWSAIFVTSTSVLASNPVVPLPELGAGRIVQPGVMFHLVKVPSITGTMNLWIYLPEKSTTPVGCVLIAPAGTPLVCGNRVGNDSTKELLPYAQQGFAVIGYDIDGPWQNEDPSNDEVKQALTAFKKADAGVGNTQIALNYALKKIPSIDARRIYTAGHSSAATLSLLAAMKEPKIRGCIAYAPCTDVEKRLAKGLPSLETMVPGTTAFIRDSSPKNHAANLRCPVFLFHCEDDANVPFSETERFVLELKKTNASVTFARAKTGGHYMPMLTEGIPQGISWLKKVDASLKGSPAKASR